MVERNDLVAKANTEDLTRARSVDEIRQDIAMRRENINETVDKLSEQVQRKLDWRVYVSEHPLIALSVAAGAGILISGIFKRRLSPAERIMSALSDSVDDITDRLRNQLDIIPGKRAGAGGMLLAAATSMIAKSASEYIGTRIGEYQNSASNRDLTGNSQQPQEQQYSRGTSG